MQLPPSVIHSAKLLAYAINDEDVQFTDRISLYVGGVGDELVRLREMPKIAICSSYNNPDEFLVFLADDDWEPKGTLVGVTLDDAKKVVERGYKGISKKWIESPYSQAETDEYLMDEYGVNPKTQWWVHVCSFCGRKDTEVERMFMRERASICVACIESFYEIIRSSR